MRTALLLCVFLAGPTGLWAANAPAKPPLISSLDAPQAGTPKVFTQQIRVSVKSDATDATSVVKTLADVTKWNVTLYKDNGTKTDLLGSTACSPPPQPGVQDCWTVNIVGGAGAASTQAPVNAPGVKSIVTVISPFSVVLTLPADTLTTSVTSVVVALDNKSFVMTPPSHPCTRFLCVATSKADSAIYLNGLYSPAFHSAAQYTIDAEGLLTTPITKKTSEATVLLGGTFSVATDNRPSADPDSFMVSGLLQWVANSNFSDRVQGVLLQWNFAGLEFDRQTTTRTFISSPVAEMPISLYPSPKSRKAKEHFSAALTPYAGLDIGTNLSNAINSGGSGLVLRGLMGSSFISTVTTKWKTLSQLQIVANYTVRLPATAEVFTNTHYISSTGKTISLPIYSTQARHHLTDELDITLQKPMVLTIKHEYGELPPGFRKVDNKISIGLTVMLSHPNSPDRVGQSSW
jgi:hypothetical protein